MLINKISEMQWSDVAHSAVRLIADTDQGNNINVHTLYNSTSIIWETIQAYPQDQILEYIPPSEMPADIAEEIAKMKAERAVNQ
jgi:hypothetical protein